MQTLRDGTRHVRRLRVRASSEALAARAQNLLADALRTATLPDRAGRLLFVRRLKLGRFNADSAAQSLALMIEREFAAIEQNAVHALDTRADAAPAVWFLDQLEAHVALALRLIDGVPADAWFWPRVVPAIAHTQDRHAALRIVLLSVAQTSTAAVALPAFVRALESVPRIAMLVESLRSEDLPLLYAVCGIAPTHAEAKALPALPAQAGASSLDDAAARVPVLSPALHAVASRLKLTHDDARLHWIAAMLPGEAGYRIRAADNIDASAPSNDAQYTPSTMQRRETDSFSSEAATSESVPPSPTVETSERSAAPAAPQHSHPESPDEPLNIYTRLEQQAWPSGDPTDAGGLLFLLRVLGVLGYAEWLERERHWAGRAIEKRLLRQVCVRLRLAREDPAWRLASIDDAKDDAHAEAAAAQWLKACRRWLRREARIGIATLVMRPARLTLTPTHADFVFGLRQLNLAVRRHGLDIDPGWIAWYGRVVSFHYEQEF